jgi:hypothetical protein
MVEPTPQWNEILRARAAAMPPGTWGEVLRDKALIITIIVIFQFFALIVFFSMKPSQLAPETRGTILQTYAIVLAVWVGYWLRDKLMSAEKPIEPATPTEPVHVIQQP